MQSPCLVGKYKDRQNFNQILLLEHVLEVPKIILVITKQTVSFKLILRLLCFEHVKNNLPDLFHRIKVTFSIERSMSN